jgi:hypothetical protein
MEPRGNSVVEGSSRVITLGIRLTRRKTGQQAQTLIDGLDWENPEPFLCGRGDNRAKSSAAEVLSPFDPAVRLLENQTRVEREWPRFAKPATEKAAEDQHRFKSSGPPSSTSRSMSTTSPRPNLTLAVMRLGLPKVRPPSEMVESPFT